MSRTCWYRCVCIHFSPRGRKNKDSRNFLLIFLGIQWWIDPILASDRASHCPQKLWYLRALGLMAFFLDLVVPFWAGFLKSPHQPFLPSYTVINLELHGGETPASPGSAFASHIPPRCPAVFLTVMHYGPFSSHPSSNKAFSFISVIFSGMKPQPPFLLSLTVILLVPKNSDTSH